MIEAGHFPAAKVIYRMYVNRLLKNNFRKFVLINKFPDTEKFGGLILTPNHFSWWDGFFADYLLRKFCGRKEYIMMLEEQLQRYKFFRYVGAFSVNTNSPDEIKKSLEYSRKIVSDKSNVLIYYPQGEIQPYEAGNIKFKKGLKKISSVMDLSIQIVSFKIVYSEYKKPSVYCRAGETINAKNLSESFDHFESCFINNVSLLDKEYNSGKGIDLFKIK